MKRLFRSKELFSETSHLTYLNKPFPVFQVEGIFQEDLYNQLYKSFPDFDSDRNYFGGGSSKLEQEKIVKFMRSHEAWDKVLAYFNSETFIHNVRKSFFFEYLMIAERSLHQRWAPWKLNGAKNRLFRNVEVKFSFGIMKNGS